MELNVKENEYAYKVFDGQEVSKNESAKAIMGYRNEGHPGANALFFPAELGYYCPVCGFDNLDRLEWSEYAGFIWCPECNLDIPSCLCVKYGEPKIGKDPLPPRERIERATNIFLSQIKDAQRRQSSKMDASASPQGSSGSEGELTNPCLECQIDCSIDCMGKKEYDRRTAESQNRQAEVVGDSAKREAKAGAYDKEVL